MKHQSPYECRFRASAHTQTWSVLTTERPPTSKEMSATPKIMLLKIQVAFLNWSMNTCDHADAGNYPGGQPLVGIDPGVGMAVMSVAS